MIRQRRGEIAGVGSTVHASSLGPMASRYVLGLKPTREIALSYNVSHMTIARLKPAGTAAADLTV